MTSSNRYTSGPGQRIRKFLVAGLDENDNPVFATKVVGKATIEIGTESNEIRAFGGDMVLGSWDVVNNVTIEIEGSPVE